MDRLAELEELLSGFVQPPRWHPDATAPEDSADWRAGYEACQDNLREALKPWWPSAGTLNIKEAE